jgi:hypothetical protein
LNPDDNDAWDLATLAAQLLRRRNTESDAVDAAWALVEGAKRKLEIEAFLNSPAMREEQEQQRADNLASLKHNVQPFIEHPFKSAYNMVVPSAQDVESIKKLFTGEALQERTPIGSQEYYDQVVGYGLPLTMTGAGMLKGRAAPDVPNINAAVRELMMTPESASPKPGIKESPEQDSNLQRKENRCRASRYSRRRTNR